MWSRKKTLKRFLSLMLTAAMLLSVMPDSVLAVCAEEPDSGLCAVDEAAENERGQADADRDTAAAAAPPALEQKTESGETEPVEATIEGKLAALAPNADALPDRDERLAETDYTEPEPAYVAEVTIGGTATQYTDIQEAFTAANAGTAENPATITLLADVTVSSTLRVENGDDITLTCETADDDHTISVSSGVDLETPLYVTGGSFTLQRGSLKGSDTGKGCIVSGGYFTMLDGTISGRRGLDVSGGHIKISGGTISGDTSFFGSGLRVLDTEAEVSLSGGSFSGNTSVDMWAGGTIGSILAPGYAYKGINWGVQEYWLSEAAASQSNSTTPVTVQKAPIQSVSISADTTTTITYGDTAPTLTATPTLLDTSMAVTYRWYQDGVVIENATSSTYTPGKLDAGSYNYTCKATADGYSLTSTPVAVKVEQKELELSITGTTTKTYDGTTDGPAGLSIEIGNAVSGDDVTVTAESYTYNSANVKEATTITAGGVTLSGDDSGNYKLPEGAVTTSGTITKSQPTITFHGSLLGQYSGKAFSYTGIKNAMTIRGASYEDVVFSWTDSEKNPLKDAPTDAGTYTLIATIPATDNTELATDSAPVTIDPKPVSNPTITLEKDSYEYDGTEKKPTVKVFDGDTEIAPKEYTVTYSNNTNVGTATVTITNNEGGNYEVNDATASFEITKPDLATATVTLILPDDGYTYDGTAKEPEIIVVKNGVTVDEDEYTVSYSNTNGGDGNHTNAGTVTVTITATADGNYSGSNSKTFEIERANIRNAVVTLTGTRFEYIGGTLEIGVQSVVLNDSKLTWRTDYTYSGQTGQDAGTYTVTVEGQGNYIGTATATWEIYQKELTVGSWTIEKTYDGTTDITLDAEDAVLYGVCYSDDVKLDVSGVTARFADAAVGEGKSIAYTGSFGLTGVTAKNYVLKYQPTLTGTITKRPISVTPDSLTKEYGTDDPTLTYKITSGSLLDGDALTLYRTSGEAVGSYLIDRYAIENQDGEDVSGNYDVTLETVNFHITRPDLSTATVILHLPKEGYIYDGTAKEPKVTVIKNRKTLEENTDYIVTYADNTDAGTALVTVKAVEEGNYYGSQGKTFEIAPYDISYEEVTLGDDPIYNGQIQTKSIEVNMGVRLIEGDDYEVTGNTGIDAGDYTLILTGKGNYTGTIERDWKIAPRGLWVYAWKISKMYDGTTDIILNAKDAVLRAGNYGIVDGDEVMLDAGGVTARFESANVGTGIAISYTGTFALTGKDADNYILAEQPDGITGTIIRRQIIVIPDADQTMEYGRTMPELTYTVGGDGMAEGESLTGTLACDIGNGAVGRYAITRGTLTATENYDLSFTDGVMFEIVKPDLSTATVTLNLPENGCIYDGTAKEPKVTVIKNGRKLEENTDYIVTYADNTDAGTASVTVKAVADGNYYGSQTVKFTVNPAGISDAVVTLANDLTYSGREQTQNVIVTWNGVELEEGKDYTVSNNNGTAAGEYTLTVVGVGNYTGSVERKFSIAKARVFVYDWQAADRTYEQGNRNVEATVTFNGEGVLSKIKHTVTAVMEDDSAGNGKSVTLTVTLTDPNYQLCTPDADPIEFWTGTTTVNIAKAVADVEDELTVTHVWDSVVTEEIDLGALLPADRGETTYTVTDCEGVVTGAVDRDSDTLTYTTVKNQAAVSGDITVTVVMNNYEDVTITIKVNLIDPLTISGLPSSITYGDEAFSLTASGGLGDSAVIWESSNEEIASVDENGEITVTGAGTVTITAAKKDGANEGDAAAAVTFTVARKAVIVSGIVAEDKVYDGTTEATLNCEGVTFEGIVEGDRLTVTAAGTFADKNAGNDKSVSVAVLTLGGADAENYVLTASGQQTKAKANITPKDITVKIAADGGVYGAVTPATAELTGVVDGDEVAVTLTYTGTANDGITTYNGAEVPTLAGTYTVSVRITDGNYNLTGAVTAEFVVERADAEFSVSPERVDKTYGDDTFSLDAIHAGGGEVTYKSDNEAVAAVDETGAVTLHNAGTATITVTLAQTANYKGGEISVTVTVGRKNDTLKADQPVYGVTYGDSGFTIGYETESGSRAAFTSSDPSVVAVDENGVVHIVGAGTATVTLSTAESRNYNAVSETVTVTVKPKAITVSADDLTKTYGEDDPELTYHAVGLVETDELTGIQLSRDSGSDVGTYIIRATQETGANPNYSVEFVNGTLTILQKDITGAVVELGEALIENGETQTQKIHGVTVQNSKGEVMDVTYTVENNTGAEPGAYIMTITGIGNFTGTITCGFVIAPAADSGEDTNPDGDTGTLPKTGDDAKPWLWMMLLLLSGGSLTAAAWYGKRKKYVK
ncbi:MAG: YDG domain-containing protein [Lachnospiraceae bacterium]|nr:YDG domain-containing protein [Lachnospiraceae bacterium]